MAFVKLERTAEMISLLYSDPAAFHLLSVIAIRADRETGEAKIGDWQKIGATSRGAYRNTLKRLLGASLVTIRTTSRGSLAKLTNTKVYDINQEGSSHIASHQSSQQAPKSQATNQATNKKYQEVFKKEVSRRGADESLVDDWLRFRGAKKNTPRALDAALKNLDYLIDKGYRPQKIFEVLNEKGWLGIKTGKNPKDQYFLDELKEHFDEREKLTDTSWANGNQPGVCNPSLDLPELYEGDERGGGAASEAVVVAGTFELLGESCDCGT